MISELLDFKSARFGSQRRGGNAIQFERPWHVESPENCYFYHTMDLPGLGEIPGHWDLRAVIVGPVLEHLNDPISALASISRVTGETMVIATDLLESDERIARFEPRANNPDQDYTWWIYSLGTYREVLGMLGFEVERVTSAHYRYVITDTAALRYTIVAKRVAG